MGKLMLCIKQTMTKTKRELKGSSEELSLIAHKHFTTGRVIQTISLRKQLRKYRKTLKQNCKTTDTNTNYNHTY